MRTISSYIAEHYQSLSDAARDMGISKQLLNHYLKSGDYYVVNGCLVKRVKDL